MTRPTSRPRPTPAAPSWEARARRTSTVDFFAGAGGWSTAALTLGIEVELAANHWDVAVATHIANHPNTRHLCQDVNLVNWNTVPRTELFLASPSCIPGEQQVVLADGTTRAAVDLAVGDLVWTHEGRARAVVNRWAKSYSGDLYVLRLSGSPGTPLRMTADHRVWVRRRGGKRRTFGDPTFVRADQLRPGDYAAVPRRAPVAGAASAFVAAHAPGRQTRTVGAHAVSARRRLGKDLPAAPRAGSTHERPGAKVLFAGDGGVGNDALELELLLRQQIRHAPGLVRLGLPQRLQVYLRKLLDFLAKL
mgnify:CR=1 FL=1